MTEELMRELSLVEGLDTSSGMKHAGNDRETYFLIIKSFMKHSTSYLEELDRALKAEAWDEYTITAHALKGALATFGAQTLSDQARRLEMSSKATGENFSPDICKTETGSFSAEIFKFRDNLSRALEAASSPDTQKGEKPQGDAQLLKEQLKLLENACKEYSYDDTQVIIAVLEKYHWGAEAQEEVEKICEFVQSYDYDKVLEKIEKL